MFKEIRTTKDGAETIQEILSLLGIKSYISVMGKSARLISFVYDKDVVKSKLTRGAGRKPKSELEGLDLYIEVKKNGVKAVAEKEGITERAVYMRLNKWHGYAKKKAPTVSGELVSRPGETGILRYSTEDDLFQIIYDDGAEGLCLTAIDNFRIKDDKGRWIEADLEKNKSGKWVLKGNEKIELEGLEILVVE